MNLTEPHAGTDLGLLRTRAEPQDDGSYRHHRHEDLHLGRRPRPRENIIHLVLAKIPGGRPARAGISLFIVPKFLVNPDGSPRRAQRASPAARSRRRWASTATPPA